VLESNTHSFAYIPSTGAIRWKTPEELHMYSENVPVCEVDTTNAPPATLNEALLKFRK
jgi:hypothetical protein